MTSVYDLELKDTTHFHFLYILVSWSEVLVTHPGHGSHWVVRLSDN